MEIKLNENELLYAIAAYLKLTLNRDISHGDIEIDCNDIEAFASIKIKPEDYRIASAVVDGKYELVLTSRIQPNRTIPFIKALRVTFGLGLKEAKDRADAIRNIQETRNVNRYVIGQFKTIEAVRLAAANFCNEEFEVETP